MKNLPFERVLALSPHTDDIEFGCGGTIARLIEQGAEVHSAIFSLCRESVPDEFPEDILLHEMHQAADVLQIPADNRHVFDYPVRRFSEHRQDLLEELVQLKKTLQPELIFTPSTNDVHQDHEIISKESIRTFRYRTLLGYELPWNDIIFSSNALIEITKEDLEKKFEAIQCYKSQGFRHYTQIEFFRGQSLVRGIQSKKKYAEAFEVIRLMM